MILMSYCLQASNRRERLVVCSSQQQQGPDISLLQPALQKQWDHTANAFLGDIVIKPHSNKMASWTCDQCPDGHPHQWTASIDKPNKWELLPTMQRSQGVSAQLSGHKSSVGSSSIGTWEANADFGTPEDIVANSNRRVQVVLFRVQTQLDCKYAQ